MDDISQITEGMKALTLGDVDCTQMEIDGAESASNPDCDYRPTWRLLAAEMQAEDEVSMEARNQLTKLFK